jgi:hypothetical protein
MYDRPISIRGFVVVSLPGSVVRGPTILADIQSGFLGGFAHVYLVRLSRPVDGLDVAVLKRVAVPDKEALTSMRTEVETMVSHRLFNVLSGRRHCLICLKTWEY